MGIDTNRVPTAIERPSQQAFQMLTRQEAWAQIGFIALFAVLFLLGLILDWQNMSALGMMDTDISRNPNQPVFLGFVVELLLTYAYWVFLLPLPFLVYFGLRQWRQSRRFLLHKQPSSGIITHLWIDPPRPPGRKYFVGFRFGDGQSAYQSVNPQRYNRLALGDPINLEFVPGEPELVTLVFSQSKRKTPTT